MTLNPRKSPAVFSVLFAWLVFPVAGSLDIWLQPHGPSTMWDPGYSRTLWRVLAFLPVEIEVWEPLEVFRGHAGNLLQLAAVLAGGGILGRLVYWRLGEERRAWRW
jgi:hypothetical protein